MLDISLKLSFIVFGAREIDGEGGVKFSKDCNFSFVSWSLQFSQASPGKRRSAGYVTSNQQRRDLYEKGRARNANERGHQLDNLKAKQQRASENARSQS